MDANGTRFHLLLGRHDWAGCSVETAGGKTSLLGEAWGSSPPQEIGLSWNNEQNELTLEPRLFNFAANGSAPSVENRRGAARDRYGNWYWIDETSLRIRVLSRGSGATSDFWPLPEDCACPKASSAGDFRPRDEENPPAPLKFSGMAITEDHYLVVGVIDPRGLLIFDLYTGGEPRQLSWPAEFVPFDMAPRPGGGVWILDRVNRGYWALDRNFNVIGDDSHDTLLAAERTDEFQPLDGSSSRGTSRRVFPGSFALLQSPLALNDPIAIESLPDGTVLILDYDPSQRFSNIYRYRYGTQLNDKMSTSSIVSLIEKENQNAFTLIGYDIAFVPQHDDNGRQLQDRLYVVGADGNQSYAFRLCLSDEKINLQPIAEYLPMRLFGGKAIVGTDTAAYYDFAENWIPLIQQRRPRYVPEATLSTSTLDGRDPDCVWHRLLIDACIPPETSVEIWSRASNDETDLRLQQWQFEPLPYLRGDGSEIPFLRRTKSANGEKSSTLKLGDGTWEFLFQRARGRFLQLRLRLTGDERATPHLRALRIYYPRFSYVTNYLPAVYREDAQSTSFLDRFLSNLEGLHTTLEDKIAAMQVLFDVRSAPAEVLDWLASWFDVALDPSWDEAKRRMFIAHAMDFFQYRGTIRGLTMALHLALDSCADETIFAGSSSKQRREEIRIVEKYLTRTMPAVALGDPTDLSGLRTVTVAPSWQPDQGRANLNQRYAKFIDPSGASAKPYPLVAPADSAEADKWTQFSQATLGFVPSTAVPASDSKAAVEAQLWQDFLARRYRRIRALNLAYGTSWASFDVVALPDELPRDGDPLNDWFRFETIVMRMQRTAHRFTVLLPVPMSLAFNPDENQRRLDLSRRIVELEKPAHTVFDVKFYWAMFRVGEARLQLDTIIDQGSRAPQLLPKLILGQGFVGESYLAPPVPEDASDRYVLGRDPLITTPN